jgi:serine/threonine protein kinase
MLTSSLLEWVRNPTFYSSFVLIIVFLQGLSVSFGSLSFFVLIGKAQHQTNSSAKDQLTGVAVAVKKIMKPFSTPVLAKRTYRELKLLKHIQHENVCTPSPTNSTYAFHSCLPQQIISLSDVFISPLEDL